MLSTHWRNNHLIRLINLVGLTLLFFALRSSVNSAQLPPPKEGTAVLTQSNPAHISLVRFFENDEMGIFHPIGLAYSPGTNRFLVLEAGADLDIIQVTSLEEREDALAIHTTVSDPINIVFDSGNGRLLFFDADANELISVEARPDGTLNPTALARHDAQPFGLIDPQGMAVDSANGRLFILDAAGPRIIRLEPGADGQLDEVVNSVLDLQPAGLVDARGLAFEPASGHLHVLDRASQQLYELTPSGQVVASRDLSGFGLINPQGMVFAPSGDMTDDPSQMNLYLADGGQGTKQSQPAFTNSRPKPGRILEFSFAEPMNPARLAPANFTATLVNTTDTWQWSPPSPDPAGIVYQPATDSLLISDSEVNEMSLYANANLFWTTFSGGLFDTANTLAYSKEPTGVAIKSDPNPNQERLAISDDDKKEIYLLKAGDDGLMGTGDDILDTQFDTLAFGSGDPEGIAFDSSGQGTLYIVDGVNREVYIVKPGPNELFDGLDDIVSNIDTFQFGLENPEGITFNENTGHLYIVGRPENILFEITPEGTLVQTIDISAADALTPAGLAYAPSSQNPSQMNIYIVDRGVDNNTYPEENDGMMYEMTLPQPPDGPVPPTPNDDNIIIVEGAQVTFNVAANDTDLNGNLVPASANTACANGSSGCAGTAHGNLVNHGDGTFTYTPGSGFAGLDGFVYEICDTDLLCSTAGVTITVFGQTALFVSSSTRGIINGLNFADEDILAYDIGSGTWSIFFDGSDVDLDSLGQDINAFHINADGSILLSLGTPDMLPNLGSIDDSDIVRFVPTSIGDNTAGSYEWYFDGSDAELMENGEDIDAIGFSPDGSLLISTSGTYDVTGASGADEDLLRFTATSLGEDTNGRWDLYFDGSDVDLNTSSDEDVNGVWVDTNGDIYLTTLGDFVVTGAAGDAADIFTCMPGSLGVDTSCTFSLAWDGSTYGFAGEIVDGLAFESSPGTLNQAPLVDAGPDQTLSWPNNVIPLNGSVSDDGLPDPPSAVTAVWSQMSGPDTAVIADPHIITTQASFSAPGTYVLRLTADDSWLTAYDELTVKVVPEFSLYLPLITSY